MVQLFVAVTDQSWFDGLSASSPHDEVNFWQPSGNREFRALRPDELFLFIRPREYLTPKEVERLIAAAKKQGRRYGLRDATMILVAFRHGLRVSELCALTWDQIDFSQGMMHVRRIKNGIGSVQQVGGEEMRMLRALTREDGGTRFVFMTERGAPMTPAGFRKFLSRLAIGAKFQFLVHPHMLRHATGYKLANDGRDTRALQHYLGHKNIMHTVRYTELSPERFKNFWED